MPVSPSCRPVCEDNPPLLPARPDDYAILPGWIPDAAACVRWAGPLIRFPLDPATLAADLAVGGGTSYFLHEGVNSAVSVSAPARTPVAPDAGLATMPPVPSDRLPGFAPGALLGFGQHRVIEPGSVHLGRILIAPAARGKGLGHVLCSQLIARALAATGAADVTLRVYRDNPAAITLYRHFGFEIVAAESDDTVFFMRASRAALPPALAQAAPDTC